MSTGTNWCSIGEAVTTFCLETSMILKWADEGSIRTEQAGTRFMRVRADDIDHRLQYVKKCSLSFQDCD